jgi:FkbM family methyltransferase
MRTGWKGSTRGPSLLGRYVPWLQQLPVAVSDDQYVYVDLRDGLSHLLLAGAPWRAAPWEQDEQALMRHLVRRGDVVFDIGAHIGLHTVLLSSLAGEIGTVHAFEANALRIPGLARTLSRLPNAVLHPVGLGDRAGVTALFVPEDQTMASLADFTQGRVGRVTRVDADIRRLDDIMAAERIPVPAFIKCDVEGAEYHVFQGAVAALDRPDAPIILYEADALSAPAFGLDVTSATALLKSLARPRYQVYWVQPGGTLRPIDLPREADHFNLLAVPEQLRERLTGTPVLGFNGGAGD